MKRVVKVLRVVVAVAILAWLGWRLYEDGSSLQLDLDEVRGSWLAGAVGTGAAALVGLALLCALGMRVAGLGSPGVGLFALRMWLQSYFWRYVPGKVLLVAERVRLGRLAGMSAAASVMLVFWETLLLTAGATLVAGGGLVWVGAEGFDGVRVLALGAALTAALTLGPRALRGLASRVERIRRWLPEGLLAVPAWTHGALSLGYAVVWLLMGASFVLTCHALGEEVGPDAALWFVVAYVAGLVTGVTPAGLGVREAVLAAGLSGSMGASTAMVMAVVHRLLMTAVELVVIGAATRIPLPDPGPEAALSGEA